MDYLLTALLVAFVYPFALLIIDKINGSSYSCRQFHWHNGSGSEYRFDGCSFHATCSKCGLEVMQDSQGNWF